MAPIKGRFEDSSYAELVRWARRYLEDHLDMMERAHTDEFGRVRPAETRGELKCLRDWIRRSAELEAAAGAGNRLSAILTPGASLEDALTKPFPANQA